jgi:hypothetical protein
MAIGRVLVAQPCQKLCVSSHPTCAESVVTANTYQPDNRALPGKVWVCGACLGHALHGSEERGGIKHHTKHVSGKGLLEVVTHM